MTKEEIGSAIIIFIMGVGVGMLCGMVATERDIYNACQIGRDISFFWHFHCSP